VVLGMVEASLSDCDFALEPNEQLMIFRPFLTAYSMPSIASDVEPLPLEFMNFTATSFADQQVPASPSALSPRAPTMPATCVPWPLSSSPDPFPLIVL
jgi:hypothetical protein